MEVTSGSATLAAEEHGAGEPTVLLIHAGVTDQRSWAGLVRELPDVRCLSYDARGYGRTTYQREDGWSDVDDAIAVLDAYDVPSAVVVACSMGGRAALDLTIEHPDRVRALALIAPAISGAPELQLEPGLEGLEELFDQAEQDEDLEVLNQLEAQVWLDGPFCPEGRVGGEPRELFLEMNRVALSAPDPGEQRQDTDAWERAGEIAVPTLVMVGEHDLAHMKANAAHLAETIPGARLVDLPGVAHLPHLEGDERTLREIAEFVASL
jgi:pimeloyl-ACP methyl ester carboxylesterase